MIDTVQEVIRFLTLMFEDLRDLYQEIILDHGKNPQNFRHPTKTNKQAKGDNPLCGDKIVVYLYVTPEAIIEGRGVF